MVVRRYYARYLSIAVGFLLLTLVMAGSHKHSTELPFLFRPSAEFDLANYIPILLMALPMAAIMLMPPLLRPDALRLYDDHFDYLPIVGWRRRVPWTSVAEITVVHDSERYPFIRVGRSDGAALTIPAGRLDRTPDDLKELLEVNRGIAAVRDLHLSNERLDARYLFPGR